MKSDDTSCSIDKASRPKPPKPPLPPKPIGYHPPARPVNENASKELAQTNASEHHVPNIVVSNVVEGKNVLQLDNSINGKGTLHHEKTAARSQECNVNGETTPKTIAPSEITDKSTARKVESHMKDSIKIPKAAMAREESLDSVDNNVCCANLATYFVHKAKNLVQPPANKNKRLPPPKPPKPKPEDIEKARKRLHSFGEEIPGGKEGFRYADDESTESSVDYKDVIFENGRIVAFNRLPKPPKSDSPEPEAVVVECDYEPLEPYQRFLDAHETNDDVFDDNTKVVNDCSNVSKEDTVRSATEMSTNTDTTNLPISIIADEKVLEDHLQAQMNDFNLCTESTALTDLVDENCSKLDQDASGTDETCIKAKTDNKNFEEAQESIETNATIVPNTCNQILVCDVAQPEPFQQGKAHKVVDSIESMRQIVGGADYAVPIKKTPLDERHSWPARGKQSKSKTPPARPPPPRKKCTSLSEESQPSSPQLDFKSFSDDDRIFKSPKIKPPRPPPPTKSPVLLRRAATASQRDPRPPPRQRRSRSRTVEITTETLKDLPESAHGIRRAVSFTSHSTVKQEAKDIYGNKADHFDDKHSYAKMKFRPLPPPPAPPRSHSKKPEKLSPAISQEAVCPSPDSWQKEVEQTAAISLSSNTPDKKSKESPKCNKVKPARPSKSGQKVLNVARSNDTSILVDENANIPPSSHCVALSDKPDNIKWCNSQANQGKEKPRRYAASTFYCDNLSSHAHDENKSKSPSPVVMRAHSASFRHQEDGTESELSGVNADVDSSANNSRQVSIERSLSKSKKGSRHSTFYYDLPPEGKQCIEKSVQTSPDFSSCSVTDKGEDSDELMDIANDIRRELNSILERRRNMGANDSDPTSSQDDLPPPMMIRRGGPGSSRSSEVSWQESSDESELELDGGPATITSPEEKKERRIFCIASEIMTSEATFVEALRLLNVDFQNAVSKCSADRGSPVVPDEVMNHIFRYLPQLQNLNENLLQDLRSRIENWEEKKKVSDVIVKIGPFLKLYSSYIREFESVTVMLDEACRKYTVFAQLVKDFEASPACQKLQLKHFLLKPVQRIPQYRLLLEDYLRHLGPASPDHDDTVKALQIVSEVANHANETMKQGDNFLKLVSIQNSLLTHHEIVKPGRIFLKEGELMKLSRRVMQSRWFILFNDSLLYLTPVQQGLYRINHELPLTGMRVSVPMQTDYRNEFSVISITRSFSLAARTAEERDEWITGLTRAIEENAVKRSSFVNVQMQQQGKTPFHMADNALGKQAPVWIPDVRVTMCQLCTTEFTITYRRHHCRACGRVVCGACSANSVRLPYLDYRFARVCDTCFDKITEDLEAESQSPSTDGKATTDSEPEAARLAAKGLRLSAANPQKQAAKKKFLPNVLKERSKREARISPTAARRVRANDQGSDISGHLFMRQKTWKRYWFVLKDKVLYTYRASEDVAAIKSLPLLGYTVDTAEMPHEGIEPSLVFVLKHSGQKNIWFYAESVGFAERWVKAMRSATVL